MADVYLQTDTCPKVIFVGNWKVSSSFLAIYRLLQCTFFLFTISSLKNPGKPWDFRNFHFCFSKIFFYKIWRIKTSSCPIIRCAQSIPFAVDISSPILEENHTYVPKPPMEEEKRKIWYSQVLIPYSIACNTCAFMGTLRRHIRKPRLLEHFFPSYPTLTP